MIISERVQKLIHLIEVEAGGRWLNYLALAIIVFALGFWYDIHSYKNFSSPEAMDAAQVARNLSAGRGFTTEFIRPFSVYLVQRHHPISAESLLSTNKIPDNGRVYGPHPDLANAPLYPLVLAAEMVVLRPDFKVETRKSFWSSGGRFQRYQSEFQIAIFNQVLLLAVVLLTFLLARRLLDIQAAWLSAILVLFSEELWKYSISGLPTLLLVVIFLGLVLCLFQFETAGQVENPDERRRLRLAAVIGLLAGLGMLTRYSFGWVIVAVVVYFALYGGSKRKDFIVASTLVFVLTVLPWIIRNLYIGGTFFGTAGYAIAEDSFAMPGSRLMQSVSPDMSMMAGWRLSPYLVKLAANVRYLIQVDMLQLGGGWMGVLFLAGLLLGLRNIIARRIRHFTLICVGIFLVVAALGRTGMTTISPDANTENPLILITPLAVIFGIGFFLTLFSQINFPALPVRYGALALVLIWVRLTFLLALLPPKNSPMAWPPYYPPEIQRVSNWMDKDELMMSDIPWAVAWYGDRQCVWTTINSQYEFFQFNDNIKPIHGLYLSRNLLDARLLSDCLGGGVSSWGGFIFDRLAVTKIKGSDASETWGSFTFGPTAAGRSANFPLRASPSDLQSGFFLADHPRWLGQ